MVTSPSSKLFLWHFFILLVCGLSLCLFSWYLLSTFYKLGAFQELGTQQWVKQANPFSDSAYLSASLFYYFPCLMLLQPWASLEDVSLLTYHFTFVPRWVSYSFWCSWLLFTQSSWRIAPSHLNFRSSFLTPHEVGPHLSSNSILNSISKVKLLFSTT